MSNEKARSLNQDSYVIGLKQTTKALMKHNVQMVIIAQDVNIHILSKVLSLAFETGVPIDFRPTRQELGSHYGIEVNATVVALLK
ncbi:ribosomal L7Ae/L30e/S12e/Gadd45 family protein [Mammaliicoccus stepanovicii]|uniref:Ribosomal protein L7Ae n=1 Tax=Mammaliicoccus stepanovicii TaxID=643214 RepID=A0A240AAC8_9STAP|nr:ribosomal L7Ae/L30e/S12e/Gadd45 family protein [Mammaliicoccus stepanovicii]PNZ77137.1 50S ribosomal protein L7ae-like protein [Mammaliicoccus stepanovicii]GGI39729.1 50S ribosomal protein L7/L12 [Mammaliicoccus stepanovicii]SNV79853.1 ribosomal protein L7Ae [Mammaliicoccus stepanovicii]